MSQSKTWLLVARKLSGEASLDELKELERLLSEDPELAYKVDLYTRYFEKPAAATRRSKAAKKESLELFRERFAQEFPENNITEAPPEMAVTDHRKVRWFRKWGAAAAVLVLIATTITWLYNSSNKPVTDVAATQQVNEVNTMPGSRSKNVLPDGTIVWLNSDSRISYNADFGREKREVTLTGEAFFDVAHNEAVPMLVHAKSVTILVKGTAFNVRSYPGSDKVQTSLIRGSVELSTQAKPQEKILLKPNEKITIEINEASGNPAVQAAPATVSGSKTYQIDLLKPSKLAAIIPEVSWVENRLVFDNEPFPDVIDKMEKWYNVDIVLANKKLEAKNFSGAFEKENISEALSALQFINHFDYELKGRTIIIQ